MTDFQIEKTVYLAAPKSRVWAFLTKADLIAQWFNTPDADLLEGQDFKLAERDSGGILCWGKVLKMSPPDVMVWDFTVGPANGHMSRVEWHLCETHGGTSLTLRHTGLPQDAAGFDLILALDKGWHGFLDTLYRAVAPCDYSARFTTAAGPIEAKEAILNGMHLWWSDRVEFSNTGFTIRFNNSHLTYEFEPACKPDTQMLWRCVDAHMIIDDVADTSEWQGTRLLWEITPTKEGSEISLTHEGLNDSLACLDVCTRGWQHYFETSLKAHLDGLCPMPQTHA